MLAGFPRTRWLRLRFSESYAVRISVKISGICEFRVIMGIMTGLLGCCSSSTLGSRENDYVKTLATLGFWLHHLPCYLGCWMNNTLAARSFSPKQSMKYHKNNWLKYNGFYRNLALTNYWALYPTMNILWGEMLWERWKARCCILSWCWWNFWPQPIRSTEFGHVTSQGFATHDPVSLEMRS